MRANTREISVTHAIGWRNAGLFLVIVITLGLLLLCFNSLLKAIYHNSYTIAAGDIRSGVLLPGFNAEEQRADGLSYRWSRAKSEIVIGPVGGGSTLVTLSLAGRPEPVPLQLQVDGSALHTLDATVAPRHYSFLLPPTAQPETRIDIQSPLYDAPDDPRDLGFVLVSVHIKQPHGALRLPPPALFMLQLAALAGLALCLWRLRLGWMWPAAGLAVALMAAIWVYLLPYAFLYTQRLAVAAWVVAALTWVLLPRLERCSWLAGPDEARLLWGIALGAIILRLTGVLYPPFSGQDLGYHHLPRMGRVLSGGLLIIEPSSEFKHGMILNPPGLYLLVMPGLLLTQDSAGLMQGLLAILDGLSALLVSLLARRIGGGRGAAIIAGVLYAANPAAFAAHSFGFYPQIFGQWLITPIALVLLAEDSTHQRRWWIAGLLLLIATLTHIGVAILGFTWMAWIWLMTLPIKRQWRQYSYLVTGPLVMIAVGLLAIVLLYADYLPVMLGQIQSDATPASRGWLPGATPLLTRGFVLALQGVGLGLLPLGLILLLGRRGWQTRSAISAAWMATAMLYLVVDLLTAYQVRYIYFMLPLGLALIALPLGRMAQRGRLARVAVWSLMALLALQGAALWLSATLGEGRISLTPLTH